MAAKCPREHLVSFHIEAEPSPEVIAPLLKQVSANKEPMVDLTIDRDDKSQRIVILLDSRTAPLPSRLIAQLERNPAVHSVSLVDYMGRSVSSSDAA
ncbi:MAG: hypothetical protein C0429_06685 [Sphingopyxis sp.]|uniref:hypothetical protein n=1 Tax=Sphingopyxis sp. L1A2A TaxID=2502247 RepID=UPI0010F9C534|nr:hypothetical protein [Sphingopyxis sp. L1A2A]MBA4306408.1 hypothetical protein [Sphingopyxis sp.]